MARNGPRLSDLSEGQRRILNKIFTKGVVFNLIILRFRGQIKSGLSVKVEILASEMPNIFRTQ